MTPTPVRQLFETHLTVRDLERSLAFYRDVVGLDLARHDRERKVAFFWVGGRGTTMLGLWAVGSTPLMMKLHTAFAVALDAVLAAPAAASVYFERHPGEHRRFVSRLIVKIQWRDPRLPQSRHEAMPEAGVVPYSQWVKLLATKITSS